jgi:hypothetical protein
VVEGRRVLPSGGGDGVFPEAVVEAGGPGGDGAEDAAGADGGEAAEDEGSAERGEGLGGAAVVFGPVPEVGAGDGEADGGGPGGEGDAGHFVTPVMRVTRSNGLAMATVPMNAVVRRV